MSRGRNDAEAAVSPERRSGSAVRGCGRVSLWSRRLRADQVLQRPGGTLVRGLCASAPGSCGEPSSSLLLPCRPGKAGWPPGWFHGALVCYSEQSLLGASSLFPLKRRVGGKRRRGMAEQLQIRLSKRSPYYCLNVSGTVSPFQGPSD